jgi:hypothetical protein
MPSWQSQHQEEAKLLVGEVLKMALIDKATWDEAYKLAAVRSLIDGPTPSTVRRIVLQEIESLLCDIEDVGRRIGRCAACAAVAQARENQGYKLSSRLLEKLVKMNRAGKLPGRRTDLFESLIRDRLSREQKRELLAMNRGHLESFGDVLARAIASYEEE